MKIEKIVKSSVKCDVEINRAFIPAAVEFDLIPEKLKAYNTDWWLAIPGDCGCDVVVVACDGEYIGYDGKKLSDRVDEYYPVVRPCLEISGLSVDDVFIFGGMEFEVVAENLAFCLGDIGITEYRSDYRAADATDYETSNAKKFVDAWFDRAKKEASL